MANKADIIEATEPQSSAKKSASRRRRILFDPEDAQEPFLCTPDKVSSVPACLVAPSQPILLGRSSVNLSVLFIYLYLPCTILMLQ